MLHAARARLERRPTNTSRRRLGEFAKEAAGVGTGPHFRVLDVGAGHGPYRPFFQHVQYESADVQDNGVVDHVCDIHQLPMADNTYDLVFCSQTLEHVRRPARAMREIGRVLKPGGEAWLSAPLVFQEHLGPSDYFRFTRFAWRYLARQAGLDVVSIQRLEGDCGVAAYHLEVATKAMPARQHLRRWIVLAMARSLARQELSNAQPGARGLVKNYRVRLRKPQAASQGAPPQGIAEEAVRARASSA
jgi:SAM-dependent methyltransferase